MPLTRPISGEFHDNVKEGASPVAPVASVASVAPVAYVAYAALPQSLSISCRFLPPNSTVAYNTPQDSAACVITTAIITKANG